MRLSWHLGRVAGIDLFLHPSALLWLLFAGSYGGPLGVLALFASITLHEYGHALMARRYGIGTRDITLYLIGGIARLERLPRSAGPELLIALAGPAVNVAIAAALVPAVALAQVAGLPDRLLFEVLCLNIGLVLFNLLPIFPMDGGRVLRALLSGWLGRTRATEVAASVGQFLAIVAGVLGVAFGQWSLAILAVFIYAAAAGERRQVRAEAWHREHHGFTDPPAPPAGFRWADRGDGIWRLVPTMGRPAGWGQPWAS